MLSTFADNGTGDSHIPMSSMVTKDSSDDLPQGLRASRSKAVDLLRSLSEVLGLEKRKALAWRRLHGRVFRSPEEMLNRGKWESHVALGYGLGCL